MKITKSQLKQMIREEYQSATQVVRSKLRPSGFTHQSAAEHGYPKEQLGWKTLEQMDDTDMRRAADDLYNVIYGHRELEDIDTMDPTEPLMMLLHAILPEEPSPR